MRTQIRLVEELKGVPRDSNDEYIKLLLLDKHLHKKVKHLSLGNKRKLSLLLSIIGTPRCLILDEASTGVDPMSRRAMWQSKKGISNNSNRENKGEV